MHVEIITPDKAAFSGEVNSLILPGVDGYFEILDGHAPLVGLLTSGQVRIKAKDQPEVLLGIGSGVVEVTHNKVSLLADSLT